MKIVPITREIWVGFFTYLDVYNEMLLATEVPFEMRLHYHNNRIRGTRTDDESDEVFSRDRPITVDGVREGDTIKFTVAYPGRYFANELGELTVNYEEQYPGCLYTGVWNEDKQKYEGEWEIDIESARKNDPNTDVVYSRGTWEMWRAKA